MRAYLSILSATLLAAASPASRAQTFGFVEECATPGADIEALLGPVRAICVGNTQGLVFDPATHGTLLVDRSGQFRGFIAKRDDKTMVFQGPVAHDGSVDDIIFWGTWMTGSITEIEDGRVSRHEKRSTSPYVAGVDPGFFFRQDVLRGQARSPLPTTGVVDYRLLGRPVLSSEGNVTMPNADNDRQPIAPFPVENSTVRIDFSNGTGVANLTFVARGARTAMRIPLLRRGPVGSTWDADCNRMPQDSCPSAEVRLYGRQGEFAGLLIQIKYNTALSEADRVSTRLTHASGSGAIALRRE